VRRKKYPISIGHLTNDRATEDQNVTSWSGYSKLRAFSTKHFTTKFYEDDTLSEDLLRKVNVVILNMTCADRALDQEELLRLDRWIDAGGSAILDAFSNWDNSGDLASEFMKPFGIDPIPGAEFGIAQTELIPPILLSAVFPPVDQSRGTSADRQEKLKLFNADDSAAVEELRCLLNGPFGPVHEIFNAGQTAFEHAPLAFALGAIPLAKTFAFLPKKVLRKTPDAIVERNGRVLIASNFHFLVDKDAWNGGYFSTTQSQALFGNFCTLACQSPPGIEFKTEPKAPLHVDISFTAMSDRLREMRATNDEFLTSKDIHYEEDTEEESSGGD
jgi:hypothetical protein